jgi:hypothetical protein
MMEGKASAAVVNPRNWRRLSFGDGDDGCIVLRRDVNPMHS